MKDDLVERVALAMRTRTRPVGTMLECEDLAHAVLAIARPAILEEAAAVAGDNYRDHGRTFGTQRARNYEHAGKTIAVAIRALMEVDSHED